jgi:hypothetical protein
VNCWVCGSPATGTCRFCGRGICRDDAKTKPFVFEVYTAGGGLYGLATEEALHCGVCEPRAEPVKMDFLDVTQKKAKR